MRQLITAPARTVVPASGERAPLMAFWADLGPLVAAMVAARPTWGARLVLAPAETLHAVAAYLRHRLSMEGKDVDAAAVAAAMDQHHARDLLREAIPEAHPRLYRLLAKCGPRALGPGTYVAINHLLRGALGPTVMRRHLVTGSTVDLLLRLAGDPVLASCAKAVLENEIRLDNLEAALLLLRGHGLAREIEDLPPGSGWRAVAVRVTADFARAECPAAPFGIPTGWCQPRRWSEIIGIGRRMQNCLASPLACTAYLEAWIGGRLVILNTADGAGLATVRHAGSGLWWISEIILDQPDVLIDCHAAQKALKTTLAAAVEAAGGRIADADPWSCMSALLAGPHG